MSQCRLCALEMDLCVRRLEAAHKLLGSTLELLRQSRDVATVMHCGGVRTTVEGCHDGDRDTDPDDSASPPASAG